MISIQSCAHVPDDLRTLADILFCSCKLYPLAAAVVLQRFHINTLYANTSRVSSRVDIGLSATL